MAIYLGSQHCCHSLHHRSDINAGSPIGQGRSRAFSLRCVRTPAVVSIAAARRAIEGVSEELNAVAMQSLDTAIVRRQVRTAFLKAQERLNHFLFKVLIYLFSKHWWCDPNPRFFSNLFLLKNIYVTFSWCFCRKLRRVYEWRRFIE